METRRRLGLEADFFFSAGPYSDKDLKVVRFEGSEGLSELFRFELQLALDDPEADFDAVLGKPGLLRIEGRQGTRYISGIVSRFEQSSERTRLTQYSADLVPRIWLLGHRQTSRIFQEMTVPEIIKQVLNSAQIPGDQFKLNLQLSYVKREYCVQYRESDLAFISRLMEEEGIYYWFEHSEKKHVLMMGDSASVHQPIEGDTKLVFHEVAGEEPEFEHIFHFRYTERVRSGEVVLRDFDFKKPTLDLTSNKAADKFKELQVYDYPGEYTQPSVGTAWSEVRLQELQTPRRLGVGKTNCRRMVPGYRYTMEEHPRQNLNREYLLTRVLHKGAQIQVFKEVAGSSAANEYSCEYSSIPSDVQFRPPRATRRPIVHGSQTAIVTGPAGEEIYPDEHGRVKVHFHWDREGKQDEKSSCWIRVSQNWAGAGWGSVIIPRIGQEVIVDFLEGDPDQPIITGRVYNGNNRPPFPLPGGKSQAGLKSSSTPGGGGYNEFVMDDTKGKELIRVHGQYDMDSTIMHDLREHVLNDRSRDVTNNETLTIGVNQSYSIGNNQSGTVGANKTLKTGANHNESIGGGKTLSVGAAHTETIGSSMTINIGSNLTENVGIIYTENVGAAMLLNVGAAMTHNVGAAYLVDVGGAMSVNVGASSSESVGGSRKLEVGSNLSEKIGGKHGETVGGAYALKAETVAIEASNQITLKCGSSKIVLKSGGDVLIKGSNITIDGSGKVAAKAGGTMVLKGSTIEEN